MTVILEGKVRRKLINIIIFHVMVILFADQLVFRIGLFAGNSSTSIVDSNMGLLRKRVAIIRMEEGLDRCRVGDGKGWCNYPSAGYAYEFKRRDGHFLAESLKLAELAVGTFGFTILSYSLLLCLASFIVHRF